MNSYCKKLLIGPYAFDKDTGRADICDESSVIFKDITEKDVFLWNNDTYVADSYLYYNGYENFNVLPQIGNSLASTELMPIKYEYSDLGYSITAMGCGITTVLLLTRVVIINGFKGINLC